MNRLAALQRLLITVLVATITVGSSVSAQTSPAFLDAVLTGGSLAGTRFGVSYSYDVSQVLPTGDSFIALTSFNFSLLGVSFTRNDISQGGQVIFRNGVLNNVTASFQGVMPAASPVTNITFGFGGPGVIAYIDRANNYATGTFAFVVTPEPATIWMFIASVPCLLMCVGWRRQLRLRGQARRSWSVSNYQRQTGITARQE